jgi:hypothetical protein
MPTTTTNFGLTKPDLNQTGWGSLINTDLDVIDTQVKAAQTAAATASAAAAAAQATANAASGGSGGSASLPPDILTSSASMAFDFSVSKSMVITVTTSVTSSTAINPTDGLDATFTIKISTAGAGFVFPANFNKAVAISTANANNAVGNVLQQKWRYDLASTKWYALTPLMY